MCVLCPENKKVFLCATRELCLAPLEESLLWKYNLVEHLHARVQTFDVLSGANKSGVIVLSPPGFARSENPLAAPQRGV